MFRTRKFLLASFSLALCTSTLAISAQVYKLHNADIAVGGIGQFTTPLTSKGPGVQKTTDSAGFLFSLRDHPVAWAGIELNYGYSRFSERYTSTVGSRNYALNLGVSMHEATGAYLFHPHFMHLQPFVGVGGGGLYFQSVQPSGQWRTAGLLEAGLDIPTSNPHYGFRIQGRSLIYRAPNFNNSNISSRSWVATSEPSVSVYRRF